MAKSIFCNNIANITNEKVEQIFLFPVNCALCYMQYAIGNDIVVDHRSAALERLQQCSVRW